MRDSSINQLSGVVWVTGLPGAGKTTLSNALVAQFKAREQQVLLLDGDNLRRIFANNDYSQDGRRALAMTYARLANDLASQGALVICATVSMFEQVRRWNRENTPHYFEVFLDIALDVLAERDQKGLYTQAAVNGDIPLPGVTTDVEFPECPDLHVTSLSDAEITSLCENIADKLQHLWC